MQTLSVAGLVKSRMSGRWMRFVGVPGSVSADGLKIIGFGQGRKGLRREESVERDQMKVIEGL